MRIMNIGEKKRKKTKEFFLQLAEQLKLTKNNRQYTLFRVVLLAVAFILVVGNWFLFDRNENYKIGLPAVKTYFAVASTQYEDTAATEELRQRAASRIVDVIVQDEKIAKEVSMKISLLRSGEYKDLLPPPLLAVFNKLKPEQQKKVTDVVVEIAEMVRKEAKNRDEQSSLIWNRLKKTDLSQSGENIAYQIMDLLLNPSVLSDTEMTSRLREDVASHIPPVIRHISPGVVLVQKGHIVTPSLAKLLLSQGYPDAAFPFRHLFFILAAIALWSCWPIWIENSLKDKLSIREWVYSSVVLSLAWILEMLFARLGGYSMAVLGITGWLCLTLPLSFSYHLIVGGGIISVMIAFGANPGAIAMGCILALFSASLGRVFFRDPASERFTIWKNLFVMGVGLGVVSLGIHWGLGIYSTYSVIFVTLLYSAIWATIVVALLPLWESAFDVISPMRLLELSHQSQPLLKRLQLEAPGTYYHTLMVGTLAEAAADKLKLNGLLVKAGAYYHDIGKLKNPRYFIENQGKGDNVHDGLSPTLSALVLISHVRDGLDIAETNKLPKILRRFIAEHHGTTIQNYFYEKAKALDSSVEEEQFRYPGPRPQSRETAIVMLADSVEAAVRGRDKPFVNSKELSAFVNSVLRTKVYDGQLYDVDFTTKELALISECFTEILKSSLHSREVKPLAEFVEKQMAKKAQVMQL